MQALDGDAGILGGLLAAAGAGTVLGTLYLAARRDMRGLGRVIAVAAMLSGVAMAAFAWSTSVTVAWILLVPVGAGMMVAAAGTNTIFQTVAADVMRSRTASFYIMAFIGLAPFGTLASSILADVIGIRGTFFGNGELCCLVALWFWRTCGDNAGDGP